MTTNHDALRFAATLEKGAAELRLYDSAQSNNYAMCAKLIRDLVEKNEALAASKPEPQAQADKTEQGMRRSKLIGNSVEGMMESGLSFTQALDATLKVYDHNEPQAQAEEPEVHHTINGVEFITLQAHREAMSVERKERENVRRANIESKQMWDMLKADYDAQREALAKLDAALDACVEALKVAGPAIRIGHNSLVALERIDDAITQAQEARK